MTHTSVLTGKWRIEENNTNRIIYNSLEELPASYAGVEAFPAPRVAVQEDGVCE